MNKIIAILLLVFGQEMYTMVPPITIFVHGSQSLTKLLSKDIWYCSKGLHSVTDLPSSSCYLHDAQLLEEMNRNKFDVNHYYTFGWSGKLSFHEREQAGKQLFEELQNLIKKYNKEYGDCPVVRIITHSHGGNVVLNMVNHFSLINKTKLKLELILLACPVQKVTERLIEHPAITRSYNIYSTFDLMQRLDYYQYQGKTYLPQRIFDTKIKNCSQILATINGHRLSHVDFVHSFVRHIPEVMKSVEDSFGCTTCNVIDKDFVFYNVFNIYDAMSGKRKN